MAQPSCHYDKLKQCPLLTNIATSVFTIWTSSKSHLSCPGSVLTGYPQLQAAEHSMKNSLNGCNLVFHIRSLRVGWFKDWLTQQLRVKPLLKFVWLSFHCSRMAAETASIAPSSGKKSPGSQPKLCFILGKKKIGFPAALSCCRGWNWATWPIRSHH